MEYTNIIKRAYYITKHHIVLWFFGLFLLGGSNLGLYKFFGIEEVTSHGKRLSDIMLYYQTHPGQLALLSFGILVFSLGAILLTNWSRIMIILTTKDIVEQAYHNVKINIPLSLRMLLPVVEVSVLTSALVLLVVSVLLVPPWLLNNYVVGTNVLWMVSVMIMLPLVFGLSALNIFTVFFMVLYKNSAKKSIIQATDLFVAKWTQLLALGIILLIIYCTAFAFGAALIYLASICFDYLMGFSGAFPKMPIPVIILVFRSIFTASMWFLFAGLNVFFNISLILLFLDMVKPVQDPEFKKAVVAPAAV